MNIIIKNYRIVGYVEKIIKDKIRDHCDITGKYSGAAHKKCNYN